MSDTHVIFGAGPLGKWTAKELITMGKTVILVNRSGKAEGIPAGARLVASDAYDTARNIAITRGAAAVYQCAQPHYSKWTESFTALQNAILVAASQNGARLVVGDNLYMYGRVKGALQEDVRYAPNTRKGRLRAEMARSVMEAHETGKVQVAIGRASDFFGPEDYAFTSYAIRPAVEGKTANLLGRADIPHTFTYIADFGRLLAVLGTRDEALGDIWFTPSCPPLTQSELLKLVEAELGRPVKFRVGGAGMMSFLGLFDKNLRETVEMLYLWNNPFIVDTRKAEQAFGLRPTPLTEAVGQTVSWCRDQINARRARLRSAAADS